MTVKQALQLTPYDDDRHSQAEQKLLEIIHKHICQRGRNSLSVTVFSQIFIANRKFKIRSNLCIVYSERFAMIHNLSFFRVNRNSRQFANSL